MAKPYEVHGVPDPFLDGRELPEYALVCTEDDNGRVFQEPDALAPGEVRRWGLATYWTPLEAALLLQGVPPDDSELYAVRRDVWHDDGVEHVTFYWKYGHEFFRAQDCLFLFERSSLAPKASPIEWIKYHSQVVREGRSAPTEFAPAYYNDWLEHFSAELAESSQGEAPILSQLEDAGRREIQHEVILAVCFALGFDPQKIPYGGKSKIESACLSRGRLFLSDNVFKRAWQEGLDKGLFKTANHEKFSPKKCSRGPHG